MSEPLPGDGLPRGQAATLACVLEATAPKVGNVHRGADFESLSFTDFLVSATAIGPAIEAAPATGIGLAVLKAMEATQALVSTNTNLGMLLLIAPLAFVPDGENWKTGIVKSLQSLNTSDACAVYNAIRMAKPGGMGEVGEMDVAGPAPDDLLAAMRAAADRDSIAKQYVAEFSLVLSTAERLAALRDAGTSLTDAVVRVHVELIAEHGDSLIARKIGPAMAQRAQLFAQAVLRAAQTSPEDYHNALADFDFWLRADGNRRNPGTTADLIAAALFVGLRDGRLQPPYR
jgi:triphosphoribosyl-dephospho-CoA synthase